MTNKISDIKEHKKKKGKMSLEDSARLAVRKYFKPEYEGVKEPKGLASGKPSKSGGFINEEEDTNE